MQQSLSGFLLSREAKNCSVRTIQWYEYAITRFIDDCKLKEANHVTAHHIRKFLVSLRETGIAASTLHGYYRALKAFFNWLYREGEIETNPMGKVEAPRKGKRIIHTFTEGEFSRMVLQFDANTFTGLRNETIVKTLYGSGMRVSEICNLKMEDVKLSQYEWHVTDRRHLRGNEGPKDRDERMIPMGDALRNAVTKWLKRREAYLSFRCIETDYLFPTDQGNRMSRHKVRAMINEAGKRAGISGKKMAPHTFRHTFAKMFIMAGGDVFALQKILGHSSLEMVKTYVELFGSDLHKKFRRFDPLERL